MTVTVIRTDITDWHTGNRKKICHLIKKGRELHFVPGYMSFHTPTRLLILVFDERLCMNRKEIKRNKNIFASFLTVVLL